MSSMFTTAEASHQHSLNTLNVLYEYDDFMASISSVIDMGCGQGLDLEWWATRTTRDDPPVPLGITCTGVDIHPHLAMTTRYKNVTYQSQDFEEPLLSSKLKFDIIWCHDSFQYVINPFQTLSNWYNLAATNAMLVLILPQTTNLEYNTQAFDQRDGCYYNYTMVSLIHMLAVCGWDCAGGFFYKEPNDPWLHAIAYKSTHAPMDPRTTKWYDLVDKNLLPESAAKGVLKYGYLRQRDLLLPWLDRSLHYIDKPPL